MPATREGSVVPPARREGSAAQGEVTWTCSSPPTTHRRGVGPSLLPGGLWFFPGLRALFGLRQQEFPGSIFLPRTVFTGRGSGPHPFGGAGGVTALPILGGTPCGLVRQRASSSLGVPWGPWGPSTLQRARDGARGLARLAGRSTLWSLALGWGCVPGPGVCKQGDATGDRGGLGQGARLCGSEGILVLPLPSSSPSFLNRKRDTNFISRVTTVSQHLPPVSFQCLKCVEHCLTEPPPVTPAHVFILGRLKQRHTWPRVVDGAVGPTAKPCRPRASFCQIEAESLPRVPLDGASLEARCLCVTERTRPPGSHAASTDHKRPPWITRLHRRRSIQGLSGLEVPVQRPMLAGQSHRVLVARKSPEMQCGHGTHHPLQAWVDSPGTVREERSSCLRMGFGGLVLGQVLAATSDNPAGHTGPRQHCVLQGDFLA